MGGQDAGMVKMPGITLSVSIPIAPHAGDKNPRTAQKFAHFHLNAPPSTTTYLI